MRECLYEVRRCAGIGLDVVQEQPYFARGKGRVDRGDSRHFVRPSFARARLRPTRHLCAFRLPKELAARLLITRHLPDGDRS